MSRRKTIIGVVVAWAIVGQIHVPAARTAAVASDVRPMPTHASEARALLNKYCVSCHDGKRRTAGLLLDQDDVDHLDARPEVWEKVLRKVRTAAMPPTGMPRPTEAEYRSLATYLESEIDRLAASAPNPGRPAVVHRLNRTEYANAIRDLLSVEIDGRSLLPPDDSGYGFDNIGDVLSLSPSLLGRYMLAAQKIARLAVGVPTGGAVIDTFRISPGIRQDDRMSESLPFGSRGGLAVRYTFPLDGEYTVKIRMQRTFLEVVRGMRERNIVAVRLDKARIKEFTVGGEVADVPPAAGDASPAQLEELRRLREERDIYIHNADRDLELRLHATAGTHVVAVSLVSDRMAAEGIAEPVVSVASIDYSRKDFDAAVDSIQISGPYQPTGPGDTPSRRTIFSCHPATARDERPCAGRILAGLARRAYRRPVTARDVDALLPFFESGRRLGTFDAGIEASLERMLVDPEFLLRIERDPPNLQPGSVYRVSDRDLASRLSFFLWSSVPDEELLGVAEAGRLKDPAVLEHQVRRMLADARSTALVTNFAGQWLYLRNMRSVAPDPEAFPAFDDNLREAFVKETELFCESILREDHSVLDFLSANYTFVNERLARHYGIPDVYGSHFRRVTFADGRRAGLLGQGSILTVTSYPTRTSPVKRGKWLLENLIGAPPPPPPPNVPALKDDEGGRPASVRERMEQHRKSPACAGCHARMDPLGFALEHFDGIGYWRANDAGVPIDASGALPDGTKFAGAEELRALLLRHGDEFVDTFTDKLLTYALGRGTEYYDGPAVRAIVGQARTNGFRLSSIVLGIVSSTPFQMRRTPDVEAASSRAQ